jgi:hypothetical protein
MEVYEGLARRDLAKVAAERPISCAADVEKPAAKKKGTAR